MVVIRPDWARVPAASILETIFVFESQVLESQAFEAPAFETRACTRREFATWNFKAGYADPQATELTSQAGPPGCRRQRQNPE